MRSFQVKRKGTYASRGSAKRSKFASRRRYRRSSRRAGSGLRSGINTYNPTKVDYVARRPRSGRAVRRARRFTRAVEKVEMRAMPKHYIVADTKDQSLSRFMCGQMFASDATYQAYFPGTVRGYGQPQYFSLNTIDDMTRVSNALFGGVGGSLPASRNQERIYVTSSKMVIDFRWHSTGYATTSGSNFYSGQLGGYIELYHLRARNANAVMDTAAIIGGFNNNVDSNSSGLIATMQAQNYGVDLFKNRYVTTQWKILSKRTLYLQPPEIVQNDSSSDPGASSGVQTVEFKGRPFNFSYYDLQNAASIPHKTEVVVGCYFGEPSLSAVNPSTGYPAQGSFSAQVIGQPSPFNFVYSATKEYIVRSMMPAVGTGTSGDKMPLADTNTLLALNA